MKKIFTLVVAALLFAASMQAQTVTINKKDGSTVTYSADEITNIQFGPTAPDTTVLHEFTGYLTVSIKFFTNMYYVDAAQMKVMQVGEQYLARFSDAQWGNGLFNITMDKGTIAGTGKISVPNQHGGGVKEYEATIGGKMTEMAISFPGLMGGTTITWHYGKAPAALKVSGDYTGTNSLMVGGMFGPYVAADALYKIVANADGTINVTTSVENYTATAMGDLTLGSYTVSNLAYDEESKSFVRDYGKDGLTVHFKAVSEGVTTMDKDYDFKDGSRVSVSLGETGTLTITNTFQIGNMPFPITATYTGTKTAR